MSFAQQAARSAIDLVSYGLKRWLSVFLLCLAVFFLLFFRKGGSHSKQCQRVLVLSLLGSSGILLGWICLRKGITFPPDIPALLLYITTPLNLLCMDTPKRQMSSRMLCFFWLPCLVSWLLVAIASHSPANYRYYMLTSGAILAVPFAFLLFKALLAWQNSPGQPGIRRCLHHVCSGCCSPQRCFYTSGIPYIRTTLSHS